MKEHLKSTRRKGKTMITTIKKISLKRKQMGKKRKVGGGNGGEAGKKDLCNESQREMEEFMIELFDLKRAFSLLLSAPLASPDISLGGFDDSPFIKEISRVPIPKKFVASVMAQYDGSTDADDLIIQYKLKRCTILF